MSDATFSAPSGPTVGLQGYNLERRPKGLYPETILRLLQRVRRTTGNRKPRPGSLKKDADMQLETVREMVGTLNDSVLQILEKGAPEARDDLLKKSFDEFGAALEEELAKGGGGAPEEEEPLFKGLGCVGRVAQLVQSVASQVKNINDGFDGWGRPITSDGKASEKGDDPASAEVADLLNGMVHIGEIALRAAVNEHVSLHEGGEVAKGMSLITVPAIEAPDDPEASIEVVTALPPELAKFATDPAMLNGMLLDASVDHALQAGVSVRRLEKALGIEGLAKAYGLEGLAKADEEEEDDEDMPPGGDDGGDEGGEGGGDQMPPGGADGGDDEAADSPFDVLGRLLAAAMIQAAHCQELVEGAQGGDEGDEMPPEGGEGGEGGDGAPAGGEGGGEVPGKKKPPFMKADATEDLRKRDDLASRVEGLETMLKGGLADMTAALRKLGDQPAPPKGAVMAVAVPKEKDGLAKVDEGSGDPKDAKGPDGYSENDLAKMNPNQRALVEIKRAQQRA